MIHVFKNGRILFKDELLRDTDEGKFISVEALPFVETKENQQALYFADLKKKIVKYKLIDLIVEEEEQD